MAHYIAQLCLDIFYLTSIEKIVIGGGISKFEGLIDKVRESFQRLNNDYIDVDEKELIQLSKI